MSVGATMRIRVLGSAAGGGFPQWNCGCPNCRGVRDGSDPRAVPRTQESVAVSADGDDWFLLNVLARDPPADRGVPRPASARAAPLADRGHRADQRRPRSLPRPALAARVAAAGRVRDRARAPRVHRGQRAVPHAGALSRAGDVADRSSSARDEELVGSTGGRPSRARRAAPCAVPGQAARAPRAAARRRSPRTTSAVRDPRAGDRARRSPTSPAAAAVTADAAARAGRRRLRVLRRHVLVERRAARARARHQARRGHGAPARRRPRAAASPRLAGAATPARRIYIHINNTNPILREDSPERGRGRRPPAGRSRTTAWRSCYER